MKKEILIYVGCALKHAPEKYKESVKLFKSKIAEIPGVKILEFVTNSNATSKEIYENDIYDCVMKCDLMIADFSLPSLGLGYEVATMLEKRNMPVIGLAHKDSVVSSLIQGIQNKNFTLHRYEDIVDMIAEIEIYININYHS